MTTTTIPTDVNGHATIGSIPMSAGGKRNALKAFIHDYSGNRCVVCGIGGVALECGHLVPGGPRKMGWVAGNIGSMCRPCNEAAGDRNLTEDVPMFAHAAGIPTVWPSWSELVERFGGTCDTRAIAADTRRALGLPW